MTWQTVALPMYHSVAHSMLWYIGTTLAGTTNYLGSDEDGPNAAANYGWYYDGSAWAHLTDFGYAPNVFLVRAKALVGGDKSVVTYGPASARATGTHRQLLYSQKLIRVSTPATSISSAVPLRR